MDNKPLSPLPIGKSSWDAKREGTVDGTSETTQDWDLRCSSASAAMNFAVKISFHQLLASVISFSGKEKKM